MQDTWVQSLIREDTTSHGAIKPMNLNFWASALEPGGQKKNPPQWEAHLLQVESRSHLLQLEESPHGNEDPQPKINKIIFLNDTDVILHV